MLKEALKSILPAAVLNTITNARDNIVGESQLAKIERLELDDTKLRALSADEIAAAFTNEGIMNAWAEDSSAIASLFGDGHYVGGVNAGDRRAIYSIILYLRPQKVLEVGTHLGATKLAGPSIISH